MSLFAILGSGFGLYGYLPALVEGCGGRIVLPERYRSRFQERLELARFASYVQWSTDEMAALNSADAAVLALPPAIQLSWLPRCLTCSSLGSVFTEKPLAPSPAVAATVLEDLVRSGKFFRVGYTFRFTGWGGRLLQALRRPAAGKSTLSIHWSFLAHHFRHDLHNWKRSSAMGGGPIRFYGIQIIALLAEIGYREVALSRAFGATSDDFEKWMAVFTGAGLPDCEVVVDSRSAVNSFRVVQTFSGGHALPSTGFADLNDPFDSDSPASAASDLDSRVPVLSALCNSLHEESANLYESYAAAIWLWYATERKTGFEAMHSVDSRTRAIFESWR